MAPADVGLVRRQQSELHTAARTRRMNRANPAASRSPCHRMQAPSWLTARDHREISATDRPGGATAAGPAACYPIAPTGGRGQ